MTTITKQITLTPEEIWKAIKGLSAEGKATLARLMDEELEMDPIHDLPKSFVRDIKLGLREARVGKVSHWRE